MRKQTLVDKSLEVGALDEPIRPNSNITSLASPELTKMTTATQSQTLQSNPIPRRLLRLLSPYSFDEIEPGKYSIAKINLHGYQNKVADYETTSAGDEPHTEKDIENAVRLTKVTTS